MAFSRVSDSQSKHKFLTKNGLGKVGSSTFLLAADQVKTRRPTQISFPLETIYLNMPRAITIAATNPHIRGWYGFSSRSGTLPHWLFMIILLNLRTTSNTFSWSLSPSKGRRKL